MFTNIPPIQGPIRETETTWHRRRDKRRRGPNPDPRHSESFPESDSKTDEDSQPKLDVTI